MSDAKGIHWVRMSDGNHPKHAVHAGTDSGNKLYVARAEHNGGIIPGKLHEGYSHAFIAYRGLELEKTHYDILVAPVASVSWITPTNGDIPAFAVVGGRDPNGDLYYIGRVCLHGTVTVGKVHPKYKSCFVPYAGKEYQFNNFEILVRNALGRSIQ